MYLDTILNDFIHIGWSQLSTQEQDRAMRTAGLPESGRCTTLCSGSGMGEICHHAVQTMLGGTFTLLSGCEQTTFKQSHLMCNVHPKIMEPDTESCLFDNIIGLHLGLGDCKYHEKKCKVKENPFLLIAGYSCKNLSTLAPCVPGDKTKVLQSGTGSSGATCLGVVKFMKAYRPKIVILENVPEMAKSEDESGNVKWLTKSLREIGYEMQTRVLVTSDYMLPQKRARAWSICLNLDAFQLKADEAHDAIYKMFETVLKLRTPAMKLDKVLFEDRHPDVEAELARRKLAYESEKANEALAHDARSKGNDEGWIRKHQRFCEDNGISWTRLRPSYEAGRSLCYKISCKRHQEIISVAERLHGKKLVATDVNPSIERAAMMHDTEVLQTLVCATKNFLMYTDMDDPSCQPRARYMLGKEALNLQGFPLSMLSDPMVDDKGVVLSDAQCSDLAGNAFSSTACASVILGVYANMPTLPPASSSSDSGDTSMQAIRNIFE